MIGAKGGGSSTLSFQIQMVSEKFRRQLRKEAEQWHAEGLIDTAVFEQLAQRYQFDTLKAENRNRFVIILFGLGAFLLGLGIITFVAANWQGWSRGVQAGLLLTLFLIVNCAGFLGWRSGQGKWQRLGKALLFLGALLLGANLALMSQMFHDSGPVYELYLLWGTGVLAMAYGLQLTWLATVAIILVGIGYWSGFPTVFNLNQTGEWPWFMPYMPLLTTGLFIPLAKICQSKWVLLWAIVAVVSSGEATVIQELAAIYQDSPWLAGGMVMFALALPPLLLWAYHPRRQAETSINFTAITRRLSILFLAGICYWFSFHGMWIDFAIREPLYPTVDYLAIVLQVLFFGGVTSYYWRQLGKSRGNSWRLTLTSTLVAMASVMIGLAASCAVIGIIPADNVLIPTVIYNLILLLIAIALVRQGLNQSNRLNFWAGLCLLTLQLLSRMLEYQTGLIFNSVILILCGVAIVMAGLWFERYLGKP